MFFYNISISTTPPPFPLKPLPYKKRWNLKSTDTENGKESADQTFWKSKNNNQWAKS